MSLKDFLFQYDFLKKLGFLMINGRKHEINLTPNKTEEPKCPSSLGSFRTYASYTVSYRTSYAASYWTSYTASYRTSYTTSYTTAFYCVPGDGFYKEIVAGGYGLHLI